MSILRYFTKIQYIDNLIRKKRTGDRKMLANKTGLSISGLNKYLNDMKMLGFPIRYDRKTNTYYYEKEGCMVKSLFENEFTNEEMQRFKGGKCVYSSLQENFSGVLIVA